MFILNSSKVQSLENGEDETFGNHDRPASRIIGSTNESSVRGNSACTSLTTLQYRSLQRGGKEQGDQDNEGRREHLGIHRTLIPECISEFYSSHTTRYQSAVGRDPPARKSTNRKRDLSEETIDKFCRNLSEFLSRQRGRCNELCERCLR